MARRSASVLAGLLAASAVLLGCGEGEGQEADSEGEIADAAVSEILANPNEFVRVRVRGTGGPLGCVGFVLSDAGAEILVYAFPLPALRVDEGDELTVIGRVGELEHHQIENVIDEAQRAGGRRGAIDVEALTDAPLGRGDPYIELINLRDEGGNQGL